MNSYTTCWDTIRYRATPLDHALVGACSKAELALVIDRLPTTGVFSELLIVFDEAKTFFRGKCNACMATMRTMVRLGCRKLFGALGKWIGAGIGAICSPAVGAIVGASVGIALGVAAAKLFFPSI